MGILKFSCDVLVIILIRKYFCREVRRTNLFDKMGESMIIQLKFSLYNGWKIRLKDVGPILLIPMRKKMNANVPLKFGA